MNFRWDKKYLYWGVTAFCVIAASTLFFIAISNLGEMSAAASALMRVLMPVIVGFVFAYLLSPVMNFFEKRCFRPWFAKLTAHRDQKKAQKKPTFTPKDNTYRTRRAARILAVFVTMTATVVVLAGVIIAMLPSLMETIVTFINNAEAYLKTANTWANQTLEDFPEARAIVTELLTNFTTYLQDFLRTSILPQMSDIVNTLSSSIINTVAALFNVLVGFIICIYLLYSKDLFAAQGKKLLYGMLTPANANLILRNLRHIHKTLGAFVTGTLIDSLLIGLIFLVVLSITNMPYVVLITIILTVTNIIPYFGPFIGAIPCGLLILLIDPVKCLYFAIIVLIVQQFDGNVLKPKIVGDTTGLSSFWVIFALLLGQHIFGFIGLIIGIPLFAVVYAIIKARVSRRLDKKNLPSDSNFYRDIAYIDKDTGEYIKLEEPKRRKIDN